MQITREPHHWIRIAEKPTVLRSGFIECQTVEANLLFEILNKLEEIQYGIINVKNILEK